MALQDVTIRSRQPGCLQGFRPDAPCRRPIPSGRDPYEKRPRVYPAAKKKSHPQEVPYTIVIKDRKR